MNAPSYSTHQTRLETCIASYNESPGVAPVLACASADIVNPKLVAMNVHRAEGASSQDLFTSNTMDNHAFSTSIICGQK